MLTIGVHDDGTPIGIDVDGFENEDKMALHLTSLIRSNLNNLALPYIHIHFDDYMDTRVMVVECKRSPNPVFLKDGNDKRFYIRTGPSTTELKADQIIEYTKDRFS